MIETKFKVVVSVLDKKFMYIVITGERFFEYNPPCIKCLINNMCITDHIRGQTSDVDNDYILVKYCNQLKKFLDGNERSFYII